jgi:hypothetical protein
MMAATVDLPPMPAETVQKLLEWHDQNKVILDNVGARGLETPWYHTKIRDTENLPNSKTIQGTLPGAPWNSDFVSQFPELVLFFNNLPLMRVGKILLLETYKECFSHIDLSSHNYSDVTYEPCNYRMTLRDTPGNSFYVQPIPENEFGSGPRKNRPSPYDRVYYHADIGKWWVLNNWCCQHGSEYTEGDRKVLISVQGTPYVKHRSLIKSNVSNVACHPINDL